MEQSMDDFIAGLKFGGDGLIPAVVQEFQSGEVLMVAYMNKESLKRTLETGKTCFYSRSRKKLWVKGETSGHFQLVKELCFDCDADTLLIKVQQLGVACHEGYKSCFFRGVRVLTDDTVESFVAWTENDSVIVHSEMDGTEEDEFLWIILKR